jgi:hypothetical protein
MLEMLDAGKEISVSIIQHAVMSIDGLEVPLDFTWKPARLIVENAVLISAKHAGLVIENA